MRGSTSFARVRWIALVLCLCASDADARDRLNYWVDVVGGSERGAGWTLLEPSETIELAFMVVNDEESKDPVILGDGFFKAFGIEIIEPESGEVVATLSEWHGFGWCAGVPNCPIDVSMTLLPGEAARFHVLLTTRDKKRPALGMRGIRLTLGGARQRIFAADGSVWSGQVGSGGIVPLELREARTADDLRRLENEKLSAALLGGDHAEALRIYQQRIAKDPADAGAYGGAGRELANLGRLTEAAAAYERAVALGAEGPGLLTHLMTVYFALGNDVRALEILRRDVPAADRERAERALRQAAAKLRGR